MHMNIYANPPWVGPPKIHKKIPEYARNCRTSMNGPRITFLYCFLVFCSNFGGPTRFFFFYFSDFRDSGVPGLCATPAGSCKKKSCDGYWGWWRDFQVFVAAGVISKSSAEEQCCSWRAVPSLRHNASAEWCPSNAPHWAKKVPTVEWFCAVPLTGHFFSQKKKLCVSWKDLGERCPLLGQRECLNCGVISETCAPYWASSLWMSAVEWSRRAEPLTGLTQKACQLWSMSDSRAPHWAHKMCLICYPCLLRSSERTDIKQKTTKKKTIIEIYIYIYLYIYRCVLSMLCSKVLDQIYPFWKFCSGPDQFEN